MNAPTVISSMQSLPQQTSTAISRMRELFSLDNSTRKPIVCYNEKETFSSCQSCLLEINSTVAIRSYRDNIDSIGVILHEKTTLDNKRTFEVLHVECARSYCNTKSTAQTALHILADTGLAQHFYDLSSSATVMSNSIICTFVYILVLMNGTI